MTEMSAYVDVPHSRSAPAASRTVVQCILQAWGYTDEAWLKSAKLVVSELVTNAVRHGGGFSGIHLQTVHDQVVIMTIDRSTMPPQRREPDDQGGRGIAIVEAIAARWGYAEYASGKRVWVELGPHPAPVDQRPGGAR